MSEENPPVTLTRYEWHKLLSELEYLMRFANRDSSMAVKLYERIGTQLHGKHVIVELK